MLTNRYALENGEAYFVQELCETCMVSIALDDPGPSTWTSISVLAASPSEPQAHIWRRVGITISAGKIVRLLRFRGSRRLADFAVLKR